MASQTFSFSSGANEQTSSAVVTAAGEKVRVRFSAFPQNGEAFLNITANSTTTSYPVSDSAAFVLDAAATADSVTITCRRNGSTIAGILETF